MSSHIDPEGDLSAALGLMIRALRILDQAGAPGDIGSHLDLAIARLEERLGVACNRPEPANVLVFQPSGRFDANEDDRTGSASGWDIAPA